MWLDFSGDASGWSGATGSGSLSGGCRAIGRRLGIEGQWRFERDDLWQAGNKSDCLGNTGQLARVSKMFEGWARAEECQKLPSPPSTASVVLFGTEQVELTAAACSEEGTRYSVPEILRRAHVPFPFSVQEPPRVVPSSEDLVVRATGGPQNGRSRPGTQALSFTSVAPSNQKSAYLIARPLEYTQVGLAFKSSRYIYQQPSQQECAIQHRAQLDAQKTTGANDTLD